MALQRVLDTGVLAPDHAFINAVRTLGATSSATARPERELPRIPRERFEVLVALGVMREASPGVYYLFEDAAGFPSEFALVPLPATPKRRAMTVGFWILALLVPATLIWLNT